MKLEVPEITVAAESHLGLVRRKNEDSFCVVRSRGGSALLAVVADGIGGHSRGEIASYICCRDLVQQFSSLDEETFLHPEKVSAFLNGTLQKINAGICRLNRANLERSPMGTTVVCAVFAPGFFVMASAGDSRFYQLDEQSVLHQLSVDHSAVADNIRKRDRAEGEVRKISGNVIFRAIGLHVNLELDVIAKDRHPGCCYLLCSDGMYRYMDEAKIRSVFMQSDTPGQVVNTCMRFSLMSGGRDNVTVIALFDGKRGNV